MTYGAQPGGLLYATESTFNEVSTSFGLALPIIGHIDLSGLTQEKQDLGAVVQLQNETTLDVRMMYGGSVTVKMFMTGHGSSVASGAVTKNQWETFLGTVLGGSDNSQSGTLVASGASATQFDVTGTEGSNLTDELLIKIGALADGDGESQFYPVASISTDTVTTKVALEDTPAASAVVYSPVNIYATESATASPTSFRMELLTATEHVHCWGMRPAPGGISFDGFSPGGLPGFTVTLSVARWAQANSTFPHAVSVDRFAPTGVASGSLFVNAHGTATRATYGVREFNFNIDLQTVDLRGPGSGNAHVDVTGFRRVKCQASCDFVLDNEAAGTNAHGDRWNTSELTQGWEHLLYTLNTTDGQSIAIYLRKAKFTGKRPLGFDVDGLQRQRLFYVAGAETAGTNDLTRSNFLIASA